MKKMKNLIKVLCVSLVVFTVLTSCASRKKAGCDAYSKNNFNQETKKELTK